MSDELPPSDPGYPGAIPLQATEWWPEYAEEDWARVNRLMNTLLHHSLQSGKGDFDIFRPDSVG